MAICPGVTKSALFNANWEAPKFVPKEYMEAIKNLQPPQTFVFSLIYYFFHIASKVKNI